jgi:hypothetical protein
LPVVTAARAPASAEVSRAIHVRPQSHLFNFAFFAADFSAPLLEGQPLLHPRYPRRGIIGDMLLHRHAQRCGRRRSLTNARPSFWPKNNLETRKPGREKPDLFSAFMASKFRFHHRRSTPSCFPAYESKVSTPWLFSRARTSARCS